MGVEPYLVASSVRAFTAQRLVRLICPDCCESYKSEGKLLYRGSGCRKCGKTGYRGRIAICEILEMDDDIRHLVLQRSAAADISAKAESSGMKTLAQDGWDKVSQGVTTSDEVLRVTSV